MTRSTAVTAALLIGLAVLALALLGWQVETLGWPPQAARLAAALAGLLAYLLLCALPLRRPWRGRRPRTAVSAPALPVLYASQTGQAKALAQRTAQSLTQAGLPAQTVPLGEVDAAALARFGRALFVVSTAGEGDAPEGALRFVRRTMAAPAALTSLEYGLLALGDRDYGRFCGFGRRLDAWLQHQGARPLFDRVEVDNGDAGALRHWQHQLGVIAGGTDLPDWQVPVYASWTLCERVLLNPGSLGGACFHIALQAPSGQTRWQAGDVVEIGPRQAPQAVQAWLAAAGLDAQQHLRSAVGGETLAERLSRSLLPPPRAGLDVQQLAETLQPLPHREYSIASLPQDGSLQLLVRQLHRPDGSLGVGAAWLTVHAPLGGAIDARLRANPGFHAPPDERPLILIGNGTGIAALRALLKARIACGHHRNWLIFGERQAAVDFFYRDELQRWLARGELEHLDTAFSRDAPQRVYVQDRLREHSARLRDWVAHKAAVYVCGSLQGMAREVDCVLREALGDAGVEQLAASGRYRRDVY